MAYRIVYGPEPKIAHRRKQTSGRLQFMICLFLIVFSLLVKSFWPEGRDKLSEYLLPGESGITQQALDAMVTDLGNGVSFGDAFTAFCEQIVENEKTTK